MAKGAVRDPARAPWLAGITVGYLVWSLAPLVLAIAYSFNAGSSVTHWEGFSLRWWMGDPAAQESIAYDPELRAALLHSVVLASLTAAIAVPCGTAFALGCRGWRSRIPRIGLWMMLLALASPPIVMGVALWLLFAFPLRSFPFGEFGWFGTRAQVLGLVTLFLPLATLVVFARLLLIDREQEEMAADLGASPRAIVRSVLLPQLRIAIAASAAVVFAGALGEFVVVDAVRGSNATRALGPAMFGSIGGATPRYSVIGTTLALAGAASFALLALAFKTVLSGRSSFPRGSVSDDPGLHAAVHEEHGPRTEG
jgi:spermidine/putrescine transport system permease protein